MNLELIGSARSYRERDSLKRLEDRVEYCLDNPVAALHLLTMVFHTNRRKNVKDGHDAESADLGAAWSAVGFFLYIFAESESAQKYSTIHEMDALIKEQGDVALSFERDLLTDSLISAFYEIFGSTLMMGSADTIPSAEIVE